MESEGDPARALFSLRKRRGVIRASVTRLETRVGKLEGDTTAPGVGDGARQSLTKLESLDKDFQSIHMKIVDFTEEDLDSEDDALGKHEDAVAALSLRLQKLVITSSSAESNNTRKSSTRKLSRLEKSLDAAQDALQAITDPGSNVPLLEQYQEQLADLKQQLAAVNEDLVSMDLEDTDALVMLHARLEKLHFACSLRVKELVCHRSAASSFASAPVAEGKGVKLPKLDVPMFDGDVLHWKQFWEQFTVSVHDCNNLSNAEKLVYLHQAIKGGSAKNAIEGLSQSGDNYLEAVDTLKSRYNRPRLTHRAHVRLIVDAPPSEMGVVRSCVVCMTLSSSTFVP